MVAAHEDLTVEERELIDDVFAAGDRELREVMLPRTEVDFLDAVDAGVQGGEGRGSTSRTAATR